MGESVTLAEATNANPLESKTMAKQIRFEEFFFTERA